MSNYLTNSKGQPISPRQPLPVDDLTSNETVSTNETLTYNGKAVAGTITVNATTYQPIMTAEGDRVASYWGNKENLVYTAKLNVVSLTETAGSAKAVIVDPDKNLEMLFESLTGTVKRYVLKATDTSGNVLYGWIFTVATSGNQYTIDVCNKRKAETKNWVGTLASFDNTSIAKIEIYRYTSSLEFGTGTTLTEEVHATDEYTTDWKELITYAQTLSNGQYFVDYMRGLIIGKRANTTASETITYNIWASATSSPASVSANVKVTAIPTATPESGTDTTGADAYATVLTPSTTFEHIMITNEGSNPVTVSIDGGTSDTFIRVPGLSLQAYDGVAITATAIQAKNASAGDNYTDLTITVW